MVGARAGAVSDLGSAAARGEGDNRVMPGGGEAPAACHGRVRPSLRLGEAALAGVLLQPLEPGGDSASPGEAKDSGVDGASVGNACGCLGLGESPGWPEKVRAGVLAGGICEAVWPSVGARAVSGEAGRRAQGGAGGAWTGCKPGGKMMPALLSLWLRVGEAVGGGVSGHSATGSTLPLSRMLKVGADWTGVWWGGSDWGRGAVAGSVGLELTPTVSGFSKTQPASVGSCCTLAARQRSTARLKRWQALLEAA